MNEPSRPARPGLACNRCETYCGKTRRTPRRHLEAESFTTSRHAAPHSLDATFSYKETICKTMAQPAWPYRPRIIQRTRPPSVAQFFARLRLVRRGQPQNGLLPPLTQPLLAVQRAELLHLDRNAPTLSPRPPKANLGPIFSISKRFRLDDLNQDAKIDIGLS